MPNNFRFNLRPFLGPLRLLSQALVVVSLFVGPTSVIAETLTAKLKQPFQISLKANPTTGFKWNAIFDRSFLQLSGASYKRDSSKPKKMMGVGGTETFVFVPIKLGSTNIDFQYRRPWEKDKKPARVKTFSIVITP